MNPVVIALGVIIVGGIVLSALIVGFAMAHAPTLPNDDNQNWRKAMRIK